MSLTCLRDDQDLKCFLGDDGTCWKCHGQVVCYFPPGDALANDMEAYSDDVCSVTLYESRCMVRYCQGTTRAREE